MHVCWMIALVSILALLLYAPVFRLPTPVFWFPTPQVAKYGAIC